LQKDKAVIEHENRKRIGFKTDENKR
jgi:hypothetical protein